MRQGLIERRRAVGLWLGVVTLALTFGTADGQPQPIKQPIGKDPVAPLPPSEPTQPVRVIVQPPPPNPADNPGPQNHAGAFVLSEALTGFIIFIFAVGAITALAVFARFCFSAAWPSDPVKLALTDPWVRANLERFEAGEPVGPPPAEEEVGNQ
jgi:hypothetical protein